MSRKVTILGSTGSIGRQSLEVIAACGMEAAALAANSNVSLMEEQARQFKPAVAALADEKAAADLRVWLADTNVHVLSGLEGVLEAAAISSADTAIAALMGMAGLRPTLASIREGKRVCLANKETLVCAGELVMDMADRCGGEVVPVDSEHSALFQCLQGCRNRSEVKRLILTASGGPFWGRDRESIYHASREQALNHPNWSMGAKITVDSATLMNKGLEFIEAMRLYRMPAEKISIVIHLESIVHSLVEYCDNAVLAQLGAPDMRLPIQYALTWPERTQAAAGPLDLLSCPPLTFREPDYESFPCLSLALAAARKGGTATAALNGANEAAVGLFLEGRIPFGQIAERVAWALNREEHVSNPNLEQILAADAAARAAALEYTPCN